MEFIKERWKKIKDMIKEKWYTKMVIYMMETGKMIKKMVMVY